MIGVAFAAVVSVSTSLAAASTNGRAPFADTSTTTSLTKVGVHPEIVCEGVDVCAKATALWLDAGHPVILRTVDGGSRWSAQPVPAGTYELYGAACPSTARCEAVGDKRVGGTVRKPLLAGDILRTAVAGKAWNTITSSKRLGRYSGISCPDTHRCEVTGFSGNTTTLSPRGLGEIVTTIDGLVKRKVIIPGAEPVHVSSVSCASMTVCSAVGDIEVSGPEAAEGIALTTSDGGAKWNIGSLPSDPAGPGSYVIGLGGVSCSSTTVCVSVGQWGLRDHLPGQHGFGGLALSSTDGGKSWRVDDVPSHLADLTGVSCTSGGCVAVGDVALYWKTGGEGTGGGAAIRSASGGSWSRQPVPAGSYQLSAVACVSTQCTAVGQTAKRGDEIIASNNDGTTWTRRPAPAGANNGLNAVSCPTKLVCEAVG